MLIGRGIYVLCQFAILVAVARLGSASALGQFVLGLAVTSPIVMLCNLQLRIILATDVRYEVRFGDYLALRNAMAVVAFALVALVAAILSNAPYTAAVVIAVGISKVIESVSDIHYGRLQRAGRATAVARSLMIRGPASLASAALAFSFVPSVTGMCAAMSACWLAILVFHDIPASHAVGKMEMQIARNIAGGRRRRHELLALARKAWPLGVATALFSLEANVPRYVVALQFDTHDLGIIGTLTYLLTVGQTLVSAVCFPAIPRLAHHYADGRTRAFSHLLWKLCGLGIVISVAALAAGAVGGSWLLAAFGPEYAAHSSLFMLIIAAGGLQLVLHTLLSALRAMQRFRAVFVLQAISLFTTTSACFAGTKLVGVNGIGWGLIVSLACSTSAAAYLIANGLNRVGPNMSSTIAHVPGSLGKQ